MVEKLNAFKFGLAGGIVTAICAALTVVCALIGLFPGYTDLAIPWLEGVYGFIGYSTSLLGVLLGAIYSGIYGFIFTLIFALIYNKLVS